MSNQVLIVKNQKKIYDAALLKITVLKYCPFEDSTKFVATNIHQQIKFFVTLFFILSKKFNRRFDNSKEYQIAKINLYLMFGLLDCIQHGFFIVIAIQDHLRYAVNISVPGIL